MRHTHLARALLAALTLAPAFAFAITDDEVNTGVQFNFSNPGARSLALGGAFTGLADDATATYANPAGLTVLRKQEFGLEVRHTQFDTPFVTGGVVSNNPFSTDDVGSGTASSSLTRPTFASWVYPSERATFALYYHRLGDFESRFSTAATEFVDPNGQGTDQALRKTTRLEYTVENIGASLGYRVSDTFSLGLSLAYSDFSISSYSGRFVDAGTTPLNEQRQNGSDNDIVYTLGALWNITPQWNLGLAYRTGGDFDYRASNVLVGTTLRIDLEPEFAVPHVFSLGLAYRPSDALLLTLDINQVEYSRLSDGIETIFQNPSTPLSIDDGTEIHLGIEYAFLEMATPMFLRGGIWRDPDHRLAFDGNAPAACNPDTFPTCLAATLYPEGDDEMHYSIGVGWAWSDRFQLDLAADFSDLVDTYSASGVFKF
jgi:long-chain fatty acid transport protein